eukprot:TRINITY_DN2760_c0_g1_i2.p1 TRINITY_DN2760_c0_g1~~TRINITY_DN2760_c0_g1_i2.p1  ORF type:complete len:343 (+),score=41.85 TRINITY_DN2760_c0_g1_i2:63-1031(+)
MGKHWHAAHFVCAFAGCGLSVVQEFFEVEDKPYCLRHCVEVLRSFCPICQKPQGKQYVVALGSQYHPTCFCCYVCSQPLVSQTSLSFFQLPSGELLCAEHKDGAGLAKAQRKRSETLSDPDYRSAEMLRLMEELKKDLTLAQVLGIPSEPAVPEQQPAADGVAPPVLWQSVYAVHADTKWGGAHSATSIALLPTYSPSCRRTPPMRPTRSWRQRTPTCGSNWQRRWPELRNLKNASGSSRLHLRFACPHCAAKLRRAGLQAPPPPPPVEDKPKTGLEMAQRAHKGGPVQLPPAAVQGDLAREAMAKALSRRQRVPTVIGVLP